MKRYGKYHSQYNGLFDAYRAVTGDSVINIHEKMRVVDPVKGRESYPGIKYIKVFVEPKGRGANFVYLGKVTRVLSDDGEGGTVINAVYNDKTLNITTTQDSTKVTVTDSSARVEDMFVTTIPTRFDAEKKEMMIINKLEV